MNQTNQTKEHQVYRCSWRMKGNSFTLTCESPVSICVRSEDLEDALDKLVSEIMTLTGDGEPSLQFVPDLPRAGERHGFFDPEYHDIGFNGYVEWIVSGGGVAQLYELGVCKKCQLGLGARTQMQRTITTRPRYDISTFYKDRNVGTMFSEAVLNHLGPHLKGKAKIIPVALSPGISKKISEKYFELSFTPDTGVAVPKDYQTLSGWRCKTCGTFTVHWSNARIGSVIYGLERARAKGAVVLVQKGSRRCVAVNKDVHAALCADKRIRGFVSELIAILNANQTLSQAEVKELKLPQIQK